MKEEIENATNAANQSALRVKELQEKLKESSSKVHSNTCM
jgi:hypothetical protein